MYKKGLVSVVIPTYKRAHLIERTIDSVLNQTYKDIECIVVNDNIINDEHSLELYKTISKYKNEKRFIFLEQDVHINGAAARNVGIHQAKGEFIAFLDDDDYWNPQKIESQVKYLNSVDDSWGAVTCLSMVMDGKKIIRASLPHKTGDIMYQILNRSISFGTGSTLIRRGVLDKCGYFDENLIRHQDLQLFACLASVTNIGIVNHHYNIIESRYSNNKVSPEKLSDVKKMYFKSVHKQINCLSKKEKRVVFIMHDFELGYVLFTSGNKKSGFKKMAEVLTSPTTFCLAVKRIVDRIITSKLKKFILRKYMD